MEMLFGKNIALTPMSHKLEHKWILWTHLPQHSDWSLNSYCKMAEFETLEDAIAHTQYIPKKLLTEFMWFLMKDGIDPMWEAKKNRNGGAFSFKVMNDSVPEMWKTATYLVVGESVSNNEIFNSKVCGITLSPKRNFCIAKIWMTDQSEQNQGLLSDALFRIAGKDGCQFGVHKKQ